MKQPLPNDGDVFRVRYPFVRCWADKFDEDGPSRFLSWRPGVEFEMEGGYGDYEGRSVAIANDEGEMILAVVAVFKPGHYPVRVFYTRKFVTPEGKEFGKTRLRIATAEKFARIAAAYQHGYSVEPYAGDPEPELVQDDSIFGGHTAAGSLPDDDEDFPF